MVGQTVMDCNFREGPKWVVAVVVDQLGPVSYTVQVQGGQRWKSTWITFVIPLTAIKANVELSANDDILDVPVQPLNSHMQ